MKKWIYAFTFCFCTTSITANPLWISTEAKYLPLLQQLDITPEAQTFASHPKDILIASVPEKKLRALSTVFHQTTQRCGGFMVHETPFLKLSPSPLWVSTPTLPQIKTANPIIFDGFDSMDPTRIESIILTLSSYHNRYYTSTTGTESAQWIAEQWSALTKDRTDAKVTLFEHTRWAQPSVMLKIKGKSDTNEALVLGGHLDSIAGYFSRSRARAPGADDNASGIAAITEVIRTFIAQNLTPEKDIYFIGYAAEEVGLRGSQEIAQDFIETGIQLAGVMQLDMTNYQGSREDIVFMQDYTDPAQVDFSVDLVKTYLPELKYGFSRCGYGCSDHASWYNQGYSAVMPFESKMEDINPYIHTRNDSFSNSGDALHALKFTKLAYAWVVELSQSKKMLSSSIQS